MPHLRNLAKSSFSFVGAFESFLVCVTDSFFSGGMDSLPQPAVTSVRTQSEEKPLDLGSFVLLHIAGSVVELIPELRKQFTHPADRVSFGR